ncbi:MAG: hypothetical protein K2Y08_03705 [Alphaproteobacteria bacterium]|nr:hypothetical protein [Alphaproteobacteria bacterium]
MRAETRKRGLRNRTDLNLEDIAHIYNLVLRGWMGYYGRYYSSALDPVLRHFNETLIVWAMRKYKDLKNRKTKVALFMQKIVRRDPKLFVLWNRGMIRVLA